MEGAEPVSPASCGECVHFNRHPGPDVGGCAPMGRRHAADPPCDGPGRWAFGMEQLRASLYGEKAAKPKREKATKPEALQGDLFG